MACDMLACHASYACHLNGGLSPITLALFRSGLFSIAAGVASNWIDAPPGDLTNARWGRVNPTCFYNHLRGTFDPFVAVRDDIPVV